VTTLTEFLKITSQQIEYNNKKNGRDYFSAAWYRLRG
jgi:hypothetical protein